MGTRSQGKLVTALYKARRQTGGLTRIQQLVRGGLQFVSFATKKTPGTFATIPLQKEVGKFTLEFK